MEVTELLSKYDQAKAVRANWHHHWQEVADYVLPTRQFETSFTQGSKRRTKIFSDVAPQAAESLAAALSGLLTNTSTKWFNLQPTNPIHAKRESVMRYLDEVSRLMMDHFDSNRSRFSVATHELYLDLVTFGTGVIFVRNTPSGPVFQARRLADFYIVEDENGDISECYRSFKMNLREAYRTFGDSLHPDVLDEIKEQGDSVQTSNIDEESDLEFVHVIIRRYHRDIFKLDHTNMKYASMYIDVNNKHMVSKGGYRRMPFLVPRYSKAPEETYGRSPAMSILPGIKVANALSRSVMEATELAIRPPITVPANGIEGPIRTSPGSIIYTRQGTKDMIRPLTSGANPMMGENLLQRQEARIEKAFFLDKLKLPDNDRMTATEIIQRRQEGLMAAAPILARLYSEFLDPLIRTTYEVMSDNNLLPPMPEAMKGVEYAPEYRSPMATSKKAASAQAFLQAVQTAGPLINTNPAVMMNINADEAFRDIFYMSGVDPTYLRTREEVAKMQKAQSDLAQQQQQAEVANTRASAAQQSAEAVNIAREAGIGV